MFENHEWPTIKKYIKFYIKFIVRYNNKFNPKFADLILAKFYLFRIKLNKVKSFHWSIKRCLPRQRTIPNYLQNSILSHSYTAMAFLVIEGLLFMFLRMGSFRSNNSQQLFVQISFHPKRQIHATVKLWRLLLLLNWRNPRPWQNLECQRLKKIFSSHQLNCRPRSYCWQALEDDWQSQQTFGE